MQAFPRELSAQALVIGTRGSGEAPSQASHSQAWSGSVQILHARSSPGPAITLR